MFTIFLGLQRLFLAAAALVLALPQQSTAVTNLTDWQQGIATNYGGMADGLQADQPSFGTEDGSCGYGLLDKNTWPYWSVAALATTNSFYINGPIQGCGMCFEIQCLNNAGQFAGRCNTVNPVSVVVQITDKCPECLSDQFDIQALTFNKLAPITNGRIDMQYRRVECVPPAPMVVFVDNNNGPGGWLRLFIEQSGGQAAISNVQVRTSNGNSAWQNLNNVYGSDWEIPTSPSYPLDVSIIGPDGETVTAYDVINSAGQIGDFPTQAQFHITNPTDNLLTYPAGSSGGSSGPSPPASPVPPATPANPPATPAAPASPSPPVISSPPTPPAGPSPPTTPGPPASPPATPAPPVQQANPSGPSPPPPSVPANLNACSTCYDHQTPVFSCAQQVGWGQCQQPWMLAGDQNAPEGFCALSCGRCTC